MIVDDDDELGLLIGPAVFLLPTIPQKYMSDRRRANISSRTVRLASQDRSTDGQSQKKFVNERHTATSRQKRRVIML